MSLASAKEWQKIGRRDHHGIALPLFSLRNPQSSGVGEFLDLLPIINWCAEVGFDLIQLLPLNDSGTESSPYSALSAMALHPLYLSLWALPFLDCLPQAEELLSQLQQCNSSRRFDYQKVYHAKLHFLRNYFEYAFEQIQTLLPYQEFVQSQKWLHNYARFSYLKKKNGLQPWWEWKITEVHDENELNFYKMTQYLAFSQWAKVKEEAERKHIFLKGDIPILINRNSACVYEHQELFNLELSAGAPPDMYSQEGQSWGFPIYDWKKQEETNFNWWKERLHVAEKLYHLYRLDHVVGFFRIWVVPKGKTAKEGYYLPVDEKEWLSQGDKIMRMLLSSSSMLPIGEDLGNVPPEVRLKLRELDVPGTKVYRWERRWNTDRSYIPVEEYIPESMTTVSTHDSSTLSGWWQDDGEEVISFCQFKGWEYVPEFSFEKRFEILHDSHRSGSLFHINLLQEYLNLFPELSWADPDAERINIPGVVLERNWTYRFRPTIEEIISHKKLKSIMKAFAALP